MGNIPQLNRIIDNIEKVIVGKRRESELALVTLMCRGHILIEDVPGVGKTSLASSLARSLGCGFRRIQFTPDIMPSDVVGFSMYNQNTGAFEYREGAVFSNVVLADEINRTSPKTQSSLLEAMEERQVTVDGVTRKIDEPFIVLATQNPLDFLGTYPLPEAQMDRFFMRISLGYPSPDEEKKMVTTIGLSNPLENLQPVISASEIVTIQQYLSKVHVDSSIVEYIVALVTHTRNNESASLGASPRASICVFKAAQAWALYCGRSYAIPDDVIEMCPHVLAHRIIVSQEAKIRGVSGYDIVNTALHAIPVPAAKRA